MRKQNFILNKYSVKYKYIYIKFYDKFFNVLKSVILNVLSSLLTWNCCLCAQSDQKYIVG